MSHKCLFLFLEHPWDTVVCRILLHVLSDLTLSIPGRCQINTVLHDCQELTKQRRSRSVPLPSDCSKTIKQLMAFAEGCPVNSLLLFSYKNLESLHTCSLRAVASVCSQF